MPTVVPKLVAPMTPNDVRALPLAPTDGFVLSRIDGVSEPRDIAASTGLAEETVVASIQKLKELGVVVDAPAPPPRVSERPPARNSSRPAAHAQRTQPQTNAPRSSPVTQAPPGRASQVPTRPPPPIDTRELQEVNDLPLDVRERILELFAQLDDLNHYELLGVSSDTDKKSIKRAYFALASIVHPDKFFRKNLGSFKPKMEAIFAKATHAHDTLTDKAQRADYDAYLEARSQTRGIEALRDAAAVEMRRVRDEIVRAGSPSDAPAQRLSPFPPRVEAAGAPPLARSETIPPAGPAKATSLPPSAPLPRHSTPPANPKALRDALARKLGRRPPIATPLPQAPPPLTTDEAVSAMKRRYEERMANAQQSQVQRYTNLGREALSRNDHVAAASAFRVALEFAPEDPELKLLFEDAQRKADALLADSYEKQARYEERNDAWTEAVKSWARVVRAKPDNAEAHERWAHALLRANGNLHQASEAAKRAVSLDPNNANYRVTLANVYVGANLTKNAKRELEAALQLQPKNADIQAMLKRVQKAG